jgi:hypothetical protein
MAAFLSLCGKTSTAGCAFSADNPAATTAKWNTLLGRLRRHPIDLGGPAGTYTYTYADALAQVLNTLLVEVATWKGRCHAASAVVDRPPRLLLLPCRPARRPGARPITPA